MNHPSPWPKAGVKVLIRGTDLVERMSGEALRDQASRLIDFGEVQLVRGDAGLQERIKEVVSQRIWLVEWFHEEEFGRFEQDGVKYTATSRLNSHMKLAQMDYPGAIEYVP